MQRGGSAPNTILPNFAKVPSCSVPPRDMVLVANPNFQQTNNTPTELRDDTAFSRPAGGARSSPAMEGTNGSNSETYVLPTGSIGAARLLMQDELYGASTRTMMLDRGLRPGMRVLDLPCGTGTVSGWIAQQVREQGSVVGADIDRDQLWVAQSQCGGVPQLEFMEANVYATGFPTGHFDMVHCRLLLC